MPFGLVWLHDYKTEVLASGQRVETQPVFLLGNSEGSIAGRENVYKKDQKIGERRKPDRTKSGNM